MHPSQLEYGVGFDNVLSQAPLESVKTFRLPLIAFFSPVEVSTHQGLLGTTRQDLFAVGQYGPETPGPKKGPTTALVKTNANQPNLNRRKRNTTKSGFSFN